jgi:biotin-dependent carboxylase-like uncharacterized protein
MPRTKLVVFKVIQPGPLTTIQDLGRYGCQKFGVPVSGALDNYALRIANLLAGNDEGEACLEITLMGPKLRLLRDTAIAVTGADLSPELNGEPLPMWQTVMVKLGDIISFDWPQKGCRSYLAVAGGIDVPMVMKSRSTYVKSGIGGYMGRPLRAGDLVASAQPPAEIPEARMAPPGIPQYRNRSQIRVILGPQDDHFTQKGIDTFLNSEYLVSPYADRTGYRLNGPSIEHTAGADIISDGIPLGAIQVPADGRPIILLADRLTTGGYPKIATVITVDISKLAQAKPGDKIRFRQTTLEDAHHYLEEYEQSLRALVQQIK